MRDSWGHKELDTTERLILSDCEKCSYPYTCKCNNPYTCKIVHPLSIPLARLNSVMSGICLVSHGIFSV